MVVWFVCLCRKVTQDAKNETYDNLLTKNVGFNNPGNMSYLAGLLGVGNEYHSVLPSLRSVFTLTNMEEEMVVCEM